MKRIIATITIILMVTGVLTVSSAQAGSSKRHTIEGIMIGTGVAILGAAIINELNDDNHYSRHHTYKRHYPPVYKKRVYREYRHANHRHHHKKYGRHSRGHYEVDRIWVEPVYETKWNPGHYNRRGKWISGRYEKYMVKQGYWSEQKVWVWH